MVSTLIYYEYFFFFKQKTAYEMRISDWSSDVCSSDLAVRLPRPPHQEAQFPRPVDPAHQRRRPRARPDLLPVYERHQAGWYRARPQGDRKSVVSGKSVSVRVDLGGCRILKKKTITEQSPMQSTIT